MKKIENLIVPEAVTQACDIFDISVEQLLQKFLDKVDLVKYFAEPMRPDRWANMFLLNCALDHIDHDAYIDSFKIFMDRITEIPSTCSADEKESIIQSVFDDWQKMMLESRIQEIMKDNGDDLLNED